MPRCQKCQREIPNAAAFCPYCGAQSTPVPAQVPPNNRVKITLIIAIAAVAVAVIVLIGIIIINSNKNHPVNPTPPVTQSTTRAVTTAAPTTVAPTTTPATTAAPAPPTTAAPPTTVPPTTAAPVTQPDNRYHSEYGWSVEIPEEWYNHGMVIEAESTTEDYVSPLRFMYKEAYESNSHTGHVFTIYAVPAGSKKDDGQSGGNPSGGFLGRNSKYAFYWWKATDVQYDSRNEQAVQEYRTLSNMRQTILDSFRLD